MGEVGREMVCFISAPITPIPWNDFVEMVILCFCSSLDEQEAV